MKKNVYAFLALLGLIFSFTACTKSGFNAPAGQIAISKTSLKRYEPDTMTLVGADSTKAVNWSFSPSGSDSTTAKVKNFARVVFRKAGTYTITATQGATTANVTVKVSDSVYAPTPYVTPLIAGETVTVVPQYVKATATALAHLAFTITTKNSYCTNSKLDFGAYVANDGTFYLSVTQILHPYDCGVTSLPVTGNYDVNYIYNTIANGTHTINFSLANKPLSGTFDVTDTQITFHWDNTNGVAISPAVLTR
jgi:hypothetical protein